VAGRALGSSAVGTVATFGASFLTTLILARLVTPTEVGIVAGPAAIVVMLRAVGCRALVISLQRFPDARPAHFRAGAVLAVAFVTATGAALFVAAPWLAEVFGSPGTAWTTRWLVVALVLHAFTVVPTARLGRELRFEGVTTSQLAASLTGGFAVPVALGALGYGSAALVAGLVVQAAVESAVLVAVARRNPPAGPATGPGAGHEPLPLREVLADVSGLAGIQASTATALQGDNVVIGTTLGPEPLGFYTRAFRIISIPSYVVADLADFVVVSIVSRNLEDRERVAEGLRRITDLLALVLLPLTALTVVLADDIVRVLLGDDWLDAVPAVWALSTGIYLRAAMKPKAAVLTGLGHTRDVLVNQATFAVAVVVAASVGSIWGIAGAASGVAVAQLGNYVDMSWRVDRALGIAWRWELVSVAQAALLAVSAGSLALVVADLTAGAPTLVRLGLASLAGCVPVAAAGLGDRRKRDQALGMLRARV
jgi:O-antigen/teichoic acid export membrane protein